MPSTRTLLSSVQVFLWSHGCVGCFSHSQQRGLIESWKQKGHCFHLEWCLLRAAHFLPAGILLCSGRMPMSQSGFLYSSPTVSCSSMMLGSHKQSLLVLSHCDPSPGTRPDAPLLYASTQVTLSLVGTSFSPTRNYYQLLISRCWCSPSQQTF